MAAGAHGSLQLEDGFSHKELARWPEVRFINRCVAVEAYLLMLLRDMGALAVLWATGVLLGGFVSSLSKNDFWYITVITAIQAAGMFHAVFDSQPLEHLRILSMSALKNVIILPSSRVKHDQHVDTKPHRASLLMGTIRSMISKVIPSVVYVVLVFVRAFCLSPPPFCGLLSAYRLMDTNYRSSAYKDNLKRGLDLFYFFCAAQGIVFIFVICRDEWLSNTLVRVVSEQVGLSEEVVLSYCVATKRKYFNSLASCHESWNLIIYGAGLLDSEMPEDNVSGARVLTTLIEQGVPVRRLLLRSPRHRIQNLIGALTWRSPAEREMRWLAARIVAHVAPDLSLAQIPGALECISSLLDTSAFKDGDPEGTYFADQPQPRLSVNSDIIFQGLRILENLAPNEHNCKLICSTEALLSKIVAPVTSENLVEDTNKNTSWAKVTNESLKLLSRLMRSPVDTGKEMRSRVADCSSALKNLEEVLAQETNSSNIIVLQIRAIEILEQLCSGESTTSTHLARERRENLIVKVLHFFFTDKWMEDYLSNTRSKLQDETASQLDKSKTSEKNQKQLRQLVENKMKEAQETVSLLKEKAGEALATLCRGNQITSDYITSFTGASQDVVLVHHLTGMLDSEESTIRCRIHAAMILKHLCTHSTLDLDSRYLKETTLNKVLRELLHIKTKGQATSTEISISQGGNDIENQGDGGHGERPPVSVKGHKQKHEERRLQIALLSLCAVIRGRWINAPDFEGVAAQLTSPEDLAEKLKKLVEENSYGTPACLAALKLTCEIVIALIPHDHGAEEVKMKEDIVDSICQVSKKMAGLESCMLFAGTDRDCYGLPVKPFFSDLVEKAREDLEKKKQELGLNAV